MALGDLREHLELTALQSQFVASPTNVLTRREFLLSPWVQGVEADLRWRRELWEFLQPRVRHESNPDALAEIVARELSLRVTVVDREDAPRAVREIWSRGWTNRDGFMALYLAGLRSVGLAARRNGSGRWEWHGNSGWQEAPWPLSFQLQGAARPPSG